ncbi:PEP-CTERM sorting domain-containing protein [Oxalobacteraceae bacterium OTU3CINTB1]|nr:PEP-CTERM sorting domain-containing protein [Oxalobacteraceae bacterium OTU3CINTB1]
MSLKSLLAAPMLVAGLLAGPANAAVILDSFGPFISPLALDNGVDANGNTYGQSHAIRFDLSAATTITSIQTAISNASGKGKLIVGIMASASDEFAADLPSGKVLFSRELAGVQNDASLAGLNWTLGAGTYWLTGSAVDANATWTSGFFGKHAISVGSGVWTGGYEDIFAPAALIEGSAADIAVVPEPETYAMVLAGLALVSGMARRRKHAA